MSVITDCPYICAPNIMDTPDYTTKMVTLDMADQTVIKAGTPISTEGKAANDETAIGILLNDCHACLGSRRGLVVISGRVKQDVAAEHSGITISDEAKSAMINVTFTGDTARAGGGGAQADWNEDDPTAAGYVNNRPGGYTAFVFGEPIETTINFTADMSGGNNYINKFGTLEDVVCDVEIDGILYKNVPSQGGSIGRYLGDPNLVEYPFVINYPEYAGGGMYWHYCLHKDPGEKSVVVTIGENTTVKIPAGLVDIPAEQMQKDIATAQKTASAVQGAFNGSSKLTFYFDKTTDGRDTFEAAGDNWYKVDDFSVPSAFIEQAERYAYGGITSRSAIDNYTNCYSFDDSWIVVLNTLGCIYKNANFNPPAIGLYARYRTQGSNPDWYTDRKIIITLRQLARELIKSAITSAEEAKASTESLAATIAALEERIAALETAGG